MNNHSNDDWMVLTGEGPIPLGLESFGDREFQWLWSFTQMYNLYPLGINSSITQKKQILINHINNHQNKNEHIRNLKISIENYLIPLEHLNWIQKDDNRKLIWLLTKCPLELNTTIPIGINSTLYKDFLLILDSCPLDANSKINFMQIKKREWEKIKTPEKEIKWLDKSNEIQLSWAWEYLKKFYKSIDPFHPPQNIDELYNSVLSSFDNMSYENISDKKLFMDRMKKTWSQKKFRDSGKAKKPYHIPLTKSTRTQLEKLAEFKNLRKDQVIEELIMKEYESTLIDERGKTKY
ncbi:hypothetical protein [Acinetobacter sp. ANC 3882]|uniref:hypothetical protein n=1 Tax=Acinetobacter sp. ANC 3882 TaxID=2923423 RepID=UPI001F4A8355|nr:hypothetical protein [Acinetobacter sp. ANC 3882]MCH7315542.1 hypothetical protein [Acinetobacter sp. ANC 3882]